MSKRQAVSEGNPREAYVAQRKSVKRDDGKNLRDFPHSREKNAGSLLCAEAASLPRGEEGLAIVRKELEQCLRCGLAKGRETIVFGEGSAEAKLMFIGEGPGRDEDLQGRPFVGRAGQLLTKIIEAIQLKRQDVYITNVVKCRPPDNRTPMPDEISTCLPFLLKQIAVVRPKIIVALGKTAASVLLQTEEPITRLRGHFYTWDHIRVMPTFHPAYLLRNPEMKRYVWEDMKLVRKALDELQSENGSEN